VHNDTIPTLFFLATNQILRHQLIFAGALDLMLLLPVAERTFHWAHAMCSLLLEEKVIHQRHKLHCYSGNPESTGVPESKALIAVHKFVISTPHSRPMSYLHNDVTISKWLITGASKRVDRIPGELPAWYNAINEFVAWTMASYSYSDGGPTVQKNDSVPFRQQMLTHGYHIEIKRLLEASILLSKRRRSAMVGYQRKVNKMRRGNDGVSRSPTTNFVTESDEDMKRRNSMTNVNDGPLCITLTFDEENVITSRLSAVTLATLSRSGVLQKRLLQADILAVMLKVSLDAVFTWSWAPLFDSSIQRNSSWRVQTHGDVSDELSKSVSDFRESSDGVAEVMGGASAMHARKRRAASSRFHSQLIHSAQARSRSSENTLVLPFHGTSFRRRRSSDNPFSTSQRRLSLMFETSPDEAEEAQRKIQSQRTLDFSVGVSLLRRSSTYGRLLVRDGVSGVSSIDPAKHHSHFQSDAELYRIAATLVDPKETGISICIEVPMLELLENVSNNDELIVDVVKVGDVSRGRDTVTTLLRAAEAWINSGTQTFAWARRALQVLNRMAHRNVHVIHRFNPTLTIEILLDFIEIDSTAASADFGVHDDVEKDELLAAFIEAGIDVNAVDEEEVLYRVAAIRAKPRRSSAIGVDLCQRSIASSTNGSNNMYDPTIVDVLTGANDDNAIAYAVACALDSPLSAVPLWNVGDTQLHTYVIATDLLSTLTSGHAALRRQIIEDSVLLTSLVKNVLCLTYQALLETPTAMVHFPTQTTRDQLCNDSVPNHVRLQQWKSNKQRQLWYRSMLSSSLSTLLALARQPRHRISLVEEGFVELLMYLLGVGRIIVNMFTERYHITSDDAFVALRAMQGSRRAAESLIIACRFESKDVMVTTTETKSRTEAREKKAHDALYSEVRRLELAGCTNINASVVDRTLDDDPRANCAWISQQMIVDSLCCVGLLLKSESSRPMGMGSYLSNSFAMNAQFGRDNVRENEEIKRGLSSALDRIASPANYGGLDAGVCTLLRTLNSAEKEIRLLAATVIEYMSSSLFSQMMEVYRRQHALHARHADLVGENNNGSVEMLEATPTSGGTDEHELDDQDSTEGANFDAVEAPPRSGAAVGPHGEAENLENDIGIGYKIESGKLQNSRSDLEDTSSSLLRPSLLFNEIQRLRAVPLMLRKLSRSQGDQALIRTNRSILNSLFSLLGREPGAQLRKQLCASYEQRTSLRALFSFLLSSITATEMDEKRVSGPNGRNSGTIGTASTRARSTSGGLNIDLSTGASGRSTKTGVSKMQARKVVEGLVTSDYELAVAAVLHDVWREEREVMPDGTFKPRIKYLKNGWEVDIANMHFSELPLEYQLANAKAAIQACGEVTKAINRGRPLDKTFLEEAAAAQHVQWLGENISWCPDEQKVPYAQLSGVEKEKDRVIVKTAIAFVQRPDLRETERSINVITALASEVQLHEFICQELAPSLNGSSDRSKEARNRGEQFFGVLTLFKGADTDMVIVEALSSLLRRLSLHDDVVCTRLQRAGGIRVLFEKIGGLQNDLQQGRTPLEAATLKSNPKLSELQRGIALRTIRHCAITLVNLCQTESVKESMQMQFKKEESWDSVIGLLMQSRDSITKEQTGRLVEHLELDDMTLHVKSMEASIVKVKEIFRTNASSSTPGVSPVSRFDVIGVRNDGFWRATRFTHRVRNWVKRVRRKSSEQKDDILIQHMSTSTTSAGSSRSNMRRRFSLDDESAGIHDSIEEVDESGLIQINEAEEDSTEEPETVGAGRTTGSAASQRGFKDIQAQLHDEEEAMKSQTMSQELQRLCNSTLAIAAYAAFYTKLIPMHSQFISRAVKAERRQKCGSGSDFAQGNKQLVATTSLRRLIAVTRVPYLPLQLQALRALRMIAMENESRIALLSAGFSDSGKGSFLKHVVKLLMDQSSRSKKLMSASLLAATSDYDNDGLLDDSQVVSTDHNVLMDGTQDGISKLGVAGRDSSTPSSRDAEGGALDSTAIHIARVARQRNDAKRQQRRFEVAVTVECIWLLFTLSFKEIAVSEAILECDRIEHALVQLTSSVYRNPRLASVALLANLSLAYKTRQISPAFDTPAMRRLIFAAQFGDVTMKGEASRLLDNLGEDPSFRQKLDVATAWEEHDVQVWLQAVSVAAWLQLTLQVMRIDGLKLLQLPYPFYKRQLSDVARGDGRNLDAVYTGIKGGFTKLQVDQRLNDVDKLLRQVHQLKLKEVLRWNKPSLLFRLREDDSGGSNNDLMQQVQTAMYDTADMFGSDCVYLIQDAGDVLKPQWTASSIEHWRLAGDLIHTADHCQRRGTFSRICTPRNDVESSPLYETPEDRAQQKRRRTAGAREVFMLNGYLNISKGELSMGEIGGHTSSRLLQNHVRHVKALRELRNAPGIIEMVNCSVTPRRHLVNLVNSFREGENGLSDKAAGEIEAAAVAASDSMPADEVRRALVLKSATVAAVAKEIEVNGGRDVISADATNDEVQNTRHVFSSRFHDLFNGPDMVPGPAPDGNFYIIFEKGQFTLDQYLRHKIDDRSDLRLTRDRCKRIISNLFGAVRHCHQQGVVHCNIHPESLICFLEPRRERDVYTAEVDHSAAAVSGDNVRGTYGELTQVWKLAEFDHAHEDGTAVDVLELPVLCDVAHAYYMPPDAALAYLMNVPKIVASVGLDLWAVGTLICAIYKARNVMLDRGAGALRSLLASEGPRILSFMQEPLSRDEDMLATIDELAERTIQFELPSSASRQTAFDTTSDAVHVGDDRFAFLRVALSDGRALALYKSKMAAAHGLDVKSDYKDGAMVAGFRGSRSDDSETLANLLKLLVGRSVGVAAVGAPIDHSEEVTGPMMLRPLQHLHESAFTNPSARAANEWLGYNYCISELGRVYRFSDHVNVDSEYDLIDMSDISGAYGLEIDPFVQKKQMKEKMSKMVKRQRVDPLSGLVRHLDGTSETYLMKYCRSDKHHRTVKFMLRDLQWSSDGSDTKDSKQRHHPLRVKDDLGRNCLHLAVQHGALTNVQTILETANLALTRGSWYLDRRDKSGYTPLHWAVLAHRGGGSGVRERGKKTDVIRGEHGEDELIGHGEAMALKMLKLLIKAGLNPNKVTGIYGTFNEPLFEGQGHRTIFHFAVMYRMRRVVQYLMSEVLGGLSISSATASLRATTEGAKLHRTLSVASMPLTPRRRKPIESSSEAAERDFVVGESQSSGGSGDALRSYFTTEDRNGMTPLALACRRAYDKAGASFFAFSHR
jgi:ankyrin repeat protein/serine/threonine protein kinase